MKHEHKNYFKHCIAFVSIFCIMIFVSACKDGSMTSSPFSGSQLNSGDSFVQTNLVSDTTSFSGARQDANVANAWGIVVSPKGDLVIAENHSSSVTTYDGRGNAVGSLVSIPL